MNLSLSISDVGITLRTGEDIWQAARALLWKHGIALGYRRLLSDLAGKPGLRIGGGRVRIEPDLFERHFPSPMTSNAQRKPSPARPRKVASSDVKIMAGGYSMDVVDWRTGELRPATGRDLAESVRVVEASGSTGPYSVTVMDVPPLLSDIATYKLCFENARSIRGAYYSSPRQAPFLARMHEVMGEPFSVILGAVSPLKLAEPDLDTLYAAADAGHNYRIRIVGYGVPGVGSPARLAQSAALVMAENYGAKLLLALALPGWTASCGCHAGWATDFRYCNYAFGAPHDFAYRVINAHLSSAIQGIDPTAEPPAVAAVLGTGACVPDEQAAAEKSASALLGALLGTRDFDGAGNLCVDDVFSLEQFVLDCEIAQQAVKMVEAGAASKLMADMSGFDEEMASILSGDEFLSLPSTVEVMRAFYRPSLLFEHMKLRTWQGKGCPDLHAEAKKRVKQKLAESTFQLDADKGKELARIYQEAEKALA